MLVEFRILAALTGNVSAVWLDLDNLKWCFRLERHGGSRSHESSLAARLFHRV
jgi:hypothetical protein